MTQKSKLLENLKKANLGYKNYIDKNKSLYYNNPNKCKECLEILSYKKRKNKFCNQSCSVTFSNKNRKISQEQKEKVSKSLLKNPYKKICKNCNEEFETKRSNRIYCSNKCSGTFKWKDKSYKKRMSKISSEIAKKRHKEGDDSFGWQSRSNFEPSYPESIAIRFFEENNILFEREVKCGRYFIDFVIYDNIAIEIDGRQHNKPERIISDKNKDKKLNKENYKVFRIKFPEHNIRKELFNILASIPSD